MSRPKFSTRFLEHAVVGALGFNFNFERDTHQPNVGERVVVSLLAIKNIGLKRDEHRLPVETGSYDDTLTEELLT